MDWVRLYITVEGQTEKQFADDTLKPHLSSYGIDVRPRVVITKRKMGQRGGVLSFDSIRGDLSRLMKEDRDPTSCFTTMIDLYALPNTFPSWEEASKQAIPIDKVVALENALRAEFNEPRFLPFIQLHEFEALLYCDLGELRRRIANSDQGIAALKKDVSGLQPEDINETQRNAPSKRIIRHIPIYEKNKVRVGAAAATAIGLPALRAKCPHFADWLTQLEQLGRPVF